MPGVKVRDGEPNESAIRRFKRAVEKAGTIALRKKNERFVKPSKLKQLAKAAAKKRLRKKQLRDMRVASGGRPARGRDR